MSHIMEANENLGKSWEENMWGKQICNFVMISHRTFERFLVLVPSEILFV